jgi:hypothetical protein
MKYNNYRAAQQYWSMVATNNPDWSISTIQHEVYNFMLISLTKSTAKVYASKLKKEMMFKTFDKKDPA